MCSQAAASSDTSLRHCANSWQIGARRPSVTGPCLLACRVLCRDKGQSKCASTAAASPGRASHRLPSSTGLGTPCLLATAGATSLCPLSTPMVSRHSCSTLQAFISFLLLGCLSSSGGHRFSTSDRCCATAAGKAGHAAQQRVATGPQHSRTVCISPGMAVPAPACLAPAPSVCHVHTTATPC